MTCEEFERVLPELEGGYTLEQEAHLASCSACSDLIADLDAISQQARLLQASEEPSPRVWNAIEIELRREGLIGEHPPESSLVAALSVRRRLTWLVPLAAALLVAFGVFLNQRRGEQLVARQQPVSVPVVATGSQPASLPNPAGAMAAEDEQLLTLVSARIPALRSAYESDLKAVNAYIRDAELSAKNNPNDDEAQLYLMNAYEQRAMVYEMALGRSLP